VSSPAATSGSSTSAIVPAAQLPIGALDTLHIDVDGQADLSKDYIVDSLGEIQMPYVGKILVDGMSSEEVRTAVIRKLSRFYQNVSVSVARLSIGQEPVSVSGAVSKTGSVLVSRGGRVNDAVQQAGVLPTSDLERVQLTNQMGITTFVNIKRYLETGDLTDNPVVNTSSIVFVPIKSAQLSQTMSVNVVGAVVRPGHLDLQGGATVYDAISLSGGLSPMAASDGIFVESIGKIVDYKLKWGDISKNPADTVSNPVLKDGDRVIIPETNRTYVVMGAVREPKVYSYAADMSLSDAIAAAGGYNSDANLQKVKVVRQLPTGSHTYVLDIREPDQGVAFKLASGDHISISTKSAGYRVDPVAVAGVIIGIWGLTR
jgi:polysaccharide export outer membrane protein